MTLCPHQDRLAKARIVLKADGEGMAMCQPCFETLRRIADRARAGERVELNEVVTTLLSLGYTERDANRFWEDLDNA